MEKQQLSKHKCFYNIISIIKQYFNVSFKLTAGVQISRQCIHTTMLF